MGSILGQKIPWRKAWQPTPVFFEDGGSYYDGESYEGGNRGGNRGGGSYARGRGRGRNANRDRMDRYSSEGYSRTGDMVERLRDLMMDAPDERTKQEIQRLVTKMEQM